MFDCLGHFLSFALDFANPEISHFKISAEYSHKYIKVELNWIISFPCAVEFLSFHFRWLSTNVHVHEWVCMQFSGRKMPPLFFRLSLIYWFECSYFVPRRKTRKREENRKRKTKREHKMPNAIDLSICLSVYLSVCLPLCMCMCICAWAWALPQYIKLNKSERKRVSLCNWNCGMCTTHIEKKKQEEEQSDFPFLVFVKWKFTYISICARLIEEWIRRDKCDKWMASNAHTDRMKRAQRMAELVDTHTRV